MKQHLINHSDVNKQRDSHQSCTTCQRVKCQINYCSTDLAWILVNKWIFGSYETNKGLLIYAALLVMSFLPRSWLMFDWMFLGLFKYLKQLSDLLWTDLFKVLETERKDVPPDTLVGFSRWKEFWNTVVCRKSSSRDCFCYFILELKAQSNNLTS